MKRRVLVVDDYEDAAEIVCVLLDVLGFESQVAHTGHDALRLAAHYQPDIVMLDISLPDASGYDLAQPIREQLTVDHPYLVAVTALGTNEDRARALEAGFDQHVVKPLDLSRLRALLTDAAGSRPGAPLSGA